MVNRKFLVHHNDSSFDVDYDTENGIEVLKFQLFSLTSVPPDEQKIVGADGYQIISADSDLIAISNKLRLLSIDEGVNEKRGLLIQEAQFSKSDEDFARMLQAEEEALLLQQAVAGEDTREMERRLRPYVEQILMYEDPNRQEEARKTVPVDDLKEKALIFLAKAGKFKPSRFEEDHAFLLQLLFWFKQSFRWVNAPSCVKCGNKTSSRGMGDALPSEICFGAYRVELYCCNFCSSITRFPRYNDPLKLLETRSGRCGEWANCFTLYCRAFGYDSRLIQDFTDHVWTECFSHHLGRWMHLDPCEGIFDTPLLYEKGWNKELNYAIAFARDGVYDVTRRYTKKWHEVLSRRIMITEPALATLLSNLTKECRTSFTSEMCSKCEESSRNEAAELERYTYSYDEASVSLPGRQSGDKTWRISRHELGSSDKNWSINCPVRICVDEHVTKIYRALSMFFEDSHSKTRALDMLSVAKRILMNLQKMPFETRTVSYPDSDSIIQNFFGQLLNALSLRSERGNEDGVITIVLAGDPIKTSLALPVALDAIDDVIRNLNAIEELDMDCFHLPFLKMKRIHSGSLLASGEELPSGIVTSAFDGLQSSKWEEPNGGRGCWMIYRVCNDEMIKLEAYELMSANDAPERDPMDWIVEGSNDAGCEWHVLDKQSCEMFESRFERKLYVIRSKGILANMFRFRFLTVRDAHSTSRFQLGIINLYIQ